MFGSKKTSKMPCRIGSLIGAGTQIRGNVVFVGGLRIDGEIEGDVGVPGGESGTLVVGERARIHGKLIAPQLRINGTISGPTISTEFVELQSHARVRGNIYYRSIAMHPGVAVDGKLVHCKSDKDSGDLELVYGDAVAQAVHK